MISGGCLGGKAQESSDCFFCGYSVCTINICGLLEHLRAIALRGRNVMHGLYRPHGPNGESREGPNAFVRCDDLMTKQLERWRRLLTHACGVNVKHSLHRSEIEERLYRGPRSPSMSRLTRAAS